MDDEGRDEIGCVDETGHVVTSAAVTSAPLGSATLTTAQ